MDFTNDDLTKLGAKLDALELTQGEHATLRAIFDAALVDDDVTGHQLQPPSMGLEIEQTATYRALVGRFIVLGESDMRLGGR